MAELDIFFKPRSIAVIGASREAGKIGNAIMQSLVRGGFKGEVYPVNPKGLSILGRKVYTSVTDIPGKVDLAVIVIPQPIVKKVIDECARKSIKNLVIITSGYSEVGNDDAEVALKEQLKHYRMRAIGPNCLGIFSSHVDTLFLPPDRLDRPGVGRVSFIVQSGALGSALLDMAAHQGLGVAKFVSYGNAAGLDEGDFISYFAKDRETKAIVMYLEGAKDGRKFLRAASGCRKPVIILKGGLTEEGNKAAASHTGALAGSAQIYQGVFKQAGLLGADSMSHAFELLRIFDVRMPRPKGRRTLVITDGGGFGITAADTLTQLDIPLAKLSGATVSKLKSSLPDIANVRNPLDILGDADTERYIQVLSAGLKDRNVDAIMLIVLPQVPRLDIDKFVDKVAPMIRNAKKPVVVVSAGAEKASYIAEKLNDLAVFSFPEQAARALKAFFTYHL